MLASDLMQRMQAARIQMALVIDEYGGTDGLVSLEDIVEMVVGDIEDEHDDEEVMFARTSDDIFVADARVELEEIASAIGPDFDVREQLEDVDTLRRARLRFARPDSGARRSGSGDPRFRVPNSRCRSAPRQTRADHAQTSACATPPAEGKRNVAAGRRASSASGPALG